MDPLVPDLLALSSLSLLAAVLLQQRALRIRRGFVPVPPKAAGGFALLEEFPEALFVIAHDGKVLFKTKRFLRLPGPYAGIGRIEELERLTGLPLRERLRRPSGTVRFELPISVPAGNDVERLPYAAISWPVDVPDAALGRAVALFPQTLTERRQREYPQLEQQLLEFLTSTAAESARIGRTAGTPAQKIEAFLQLGRQTAELTGYVQALHAPLRTRRAVERVALKAVLDSALRQQRSAGIRTLSTVAAASEVLGNPEDLRLLLTLLLELTTSVTTPGTSLRLDGRVTGSRVQLNFEYEAKTETADAVQKMRLTLARQLTVKLAGTLVVSKGHCRLTLLAPTPPAAS